MGQGTWGRGERWVRFVKKGLGIEAKDGDWKSWEGMAGGNGGFVLSVGWGMGGDEFGEMGSGSVARIAREGEWARRADGG
jgi:hypothetical protein